MRICNKVHYVDSEQAGRQQRAFPSPARGSAAIQIRVARCLHRIAYFAKRRFQALFEGRVIKRMIENLGRGFIPFDCPSQEVSDVVHAGSHHRRSDQPSLWTFPEQPDKS